MPGLPGPKEEPQLGPRLFRISCLGMDELHRLVIHPRRHATAPKEVADEGIEARGIADVDFQHSFLIIGLRPCGQSDPKARSRQLEV